MLHRFKTHIFQDQVVDILKEMVSRPSHPGVENQETKVAEYIADLLTKNGIVAEIIPVMNGRCNVVGRLKGTGGGKTLLLTGHTDTVPPYDMQNPYEIIEKENKLYGRGAVDMKGALASMLAAMIGIKRAGIELKGDLIFAGVIDEEEASRGTIDLIEKGIQADGAIVGEPSDLEICIAHRGLEWFEFSFKGKSVHGGRQKEGINAIVKASDFIKKVDSELVPKLDQRIHPVAGSSSMNYGLIHGGTQPSTVAGDCILQVDRRWVPEEKYENVINEYQEIIDALSKADDKFSCELKVLDCSVMKEGYVHQAMEIDPNHRLVAILSDTIKQVTGRESSKTSFPAWSDGGLLCHYSKIPTVVCGPGELLTAHSAVEHIEKAALLDGALIYAMTAVCFCNELR